MNSQGQKLYDTASTDGPEGRSKTSIPDLNLRRRRFVRGAAYVAPVVLTLRSGALAAATSACTGVKAINATVDENGQISAIVGNAAPGDYCLANAQACTPSQLGKIGAGTLDANVITANGGNLICGNARAGSGATIQVAILSTTSATSLIGRA